MIWAWMSSCFLVNLTPDHINPSGGFSSKRVNWVKPVPWIRQICWPIDIPIIIDTFLLLDTQIRTSISGDNNVLQWNREWFLLSASKVWLWVQRDGGTWSFLIWTKNHSSLHWHPEMSREVVEETLLILQENQRDLSPRIDRCRTKVDVLRSWSPPRGLIRPSAIGKTKLSFFFGKYHLFRIESFQSRFLNASIDSNSSRSATSTSSFQIPPAYNTYPRNTPGKTFFPNWLDSWLVLRRNRVILNQWTKWNNRSF